MDGGDVYGVPCEKVSHFGEELQSRDRENRTDSLACLDSNFCHIEL